MFRTIGFRFSGTAVSPHKNIQLKRSINEKAQIKYAQMMENIYFSLTNPYDNKG